MKAILFNGIPEALLVRHQKGFWLLPGGGINENELDIERNVLPTLERIVLWRELQEEIGLDKKGERLLKSKSCLSVCTVDWKRSPNYYSGFDLVMAIYLGGRDRFPVKIQPGEEIVDYCWTNPFAPRVEGGRIVPNTEEALLAFRRVVAGRMAQGYLLLDHQSRTV